MQNTPSRRRRLVAGLALAAAAASGAAASAASAAPASSSAAAAGAALVDTRPNVSGGLHRIPQATSTPSGGSRTTSGTSAANLRSPAAVEAALGVGGAVEYGVDRQACAPTGPDAVSCDAMVRVPASSTAKGAYAYRVGRKTGPSGGYTPNDLATAYTVNPKQSTKGQLVAIVDWFQYPTARADLNAYDKYFGLPKETSTSLRIVNQRGKTSPLPKKDAKGSSEMVEQSLDLEAVRAVCHTCRILLVEADAPTMNNLASSENTAARLGATEISNSFGAPEKAIASTLTSKVVNAYNHPGIVVTASTGDHGWYGWDFWNDPNLTSQSSASFPSTSPTVVAVGGTELILNSTGKRYTEAVWNGNGFDDNGGQVPQGAGGGGCSQIFSAAPWQSALANYRAAGCQFTNGNDSRMAADVSALADSRFGLDVLNTYGPKGKHHYWQTVGGTSLASPVIAGMYALAGGAHHSAYPAATLYINAHLHPSTSYDVVPENQTDTFADGNSYCGGADPDLCDGLSPTGDNVNDPNGRGLIDCSFPLDGSPIDPNNPPPLSPECNVMKGYDGPTGVGTPASLSLFAATTPSISAHIPTKARRGQSVHVSAKATEHITATTVTDYHWAWGDGSSDDSASGSATHTYRRAGTYTVSLIVVDTRHQETLATGKITIS